MTSNIGSVSNFSGLKNRSKLDDMAVPKEWIKIEIEIEIENNTSYRMCRKLYRKLRILEKIVLNISHILVDNWNTHTLSIALWLIRNDMSLHCCKIKYMSTSNTKIK